MCLGGGGPLRERAEARAAQLRYYRVAWLSSLPFLGSFEVKTWRHSTVPLLGI
jgi:hypothetical protein